MAAEFISLDEHQDWPGMVHGGILATLLYEVIENLLFIVGTATMNRRAWR